jgi:hypothetical protein
MLHPVPWSLQRETKPLAEKIMHMRYIYQNIDATATKIIIWFLSCLITGALIYELVGDPYTVNMNRTRRNQRIELRRRMEADEEEYDLEPITK